MPSTLSSRYRGPALATLQQAERPTYIDTLLPHLTHADAPGQARMELAAVLTEAGSSASAMRVLRTVLALPVNSAAQKDAHNALAVMLDRTEGRLEQAEYHLRSALAVDPSYAPAMLNLANCLWQQYRWQEALALFRQSAALEPDESEYAYSLAAAHFELGRAEEARRGFIYALGLNPSNYHALTGLG